MEPFKKKRVGKGVVHFIKDGEFACILKNDEWTMCRVMTDEILHRIKLPYADPNMVMCDGETLFVLERTLMQITVWNVKTESIVSTIETGNVDNGEDLRISNILQAGELLIIGFWSEEYLGIYSWRNARLVRVVPSTRRIVNIDILHNNETLVVRKANFNNEDGEICYWDISSPGRRVVRILLEAEYIEKIGDAKRVKTLLGFLRRDGDRAMLAKILRWLFW